MSNPVATIDKKLNLMQADFVEHLCTDALNNASLAYRLSYPKCKSGVRQAARNLLTKTYIIKAIAVKKAEIRKKRGFTVEDAHNLYERAYEAAEAAKQTGAMVGAATGISRLYGMDKDSGGGREQTIIIIGPKQPLVDGFSPMTKAGKGIVKAVISQPVASDEQIEGDSTSGND